MSRVGSSPVVVPEGVEVVIKPDLITVKGSKGSLKLDMLPVLSIVRKDNLIIFEDQAKTPLSKQLWGTYRVLVNNMITGVTQGVSKTLELKGVGFRALVKGKQLVLNLGYSHDVVVDIPEGITIECPEATVVVVSGIDKQLVGKVSAYIKGLRKIEPYKGKGIRYKDEVVILKEGKKK